MTNYYPRRIQPADSLLYDAQGNLVGLRSGTSGDEAIYGLNSTEYPAVQSLVSEAWMSPALQALLGYAPTRIYLDETPLWLDNSPIFN